MFPVCDHGCWLKYVSDGELAPRAHFDITKHIHLGEFVIAVLKFQKVAVCLKHFREDFVD